MENMRVEEKSGKKRRVDQLQAKQGVLQYFCVACYSSGKKGAMPRGL